MVNSLVGNDYTEVLTLTREEKDQQREEEKERKEAKAAHLADTAPPTKKRKLKEKKEQNQVRKCLKLKFFILCRGIMSQALLLWSCTTW